MDADKHMDQVEAFLWMGVLMLTSIHKKTKTGVVYVTHCNTQCTLLSIDQSFLHCSTWTQQQLIHLLVEHVSSLAILSHSVTDTTHSSSANVLISLVSCGFGVYVVWT